MVRERLHWQQRLCKRMGLMIWSLNLRMGKLRNLGMIVHSDTEIHNNDTVQDFCDNYEQWAIDSWTEAWSRLSCTMWKSCMFRAFWAEALSVEADLVATIQLLYVEVIPSAAEAKSKQPIDFCWRSEVKLSIISSLLLTCFSGKFTSKKKDI